MGEVCQQLSVKVCKTWFDTQRTHYGKLTQSKSGQAPKEMTERQKWIQEKFNFLKTHTDTRDSANLQASSPLPEEPVHLLPQHMASTAVQPTWIVWRSVTTVQPPVTSPWTVSQHSLVDQQVMDQFAQMKTMLSSFLRPRQETIKTALCNYLASEVEALENRYFQTFRNEAIKLLSGIQRRAEERSCQPQQPTLPRSSNATSTFVPQTFQQPL